MKYLLIILSLMAVVPAQARRRAMHDEVSNTSCGLTKYGREEVDAINVNGSLKLDGTIVRNAVVVNGELEADKATMGSLTVNGLADLDECIVHGQALLNGDVKAKKTVFEGLLSVSSNKIALKDSTISEIKVRPSGNNEKQIIKLRKKTTVKGPITFESKNGEVWLYGDSRIEGPVEGGVIVRK